MDRCRSAHHGELIRRLRTGSIQRANGHTLGAPTFPDGATNRQIGATASIGDGFQSSPSSSRSMFAAGVGIVHRF